MTDADAWLLVDITCSPDISGFVSAELWACGVAAIEEIDGADGRVTLRTSLGGESANVLETALARFPEVTVRPVRIDKAVADTWREHATATHVAGDVWLVPAWSEPPEGTAILIEPFDTFGLGNHPTTVLTLRESLGLCDDSTRVLDLGCGSGVLAVAVARVCGSHVDAHDIAVHAEDALRHNAALNGVSGLVSWRGPVDERGDRRYGVVMANILAPVLRSLAGTIVAITEPGGHIVLSGLRTEQVADVVSRFAGCSETKRSELDGWAAVTLRTAG